MTLDKEMVEKLEKAKEDIEKGEQFQGLAIIAILEVLLEAAEEERLNNLN